MDLRFGFCNDTFDYYLYALAWAFVRFDPAQIRMTAS